MSAVLVTAGAAVLVGAGSALVPVLNAEAYALVAVAARPDVLVLVVLGLAVGQTVGKLVIYEAARRGVAKARGKAPARQGHRSSRVVAALQERRTAVPIVFAAASVGLPPLAVASVAAGCARQPRVLFGVTCLAGRVVRFAVIAVPVARLATHGS
ncbi:hypothetical protein [Aeromicrobium erythreum]|uniref:Uncharacterized protein n=1 Tax=Aeromicrobium erythreum TaxID=2041 RepID=A0A0U4CEE6_9ACTN|nr:hypothetical protein [Aeromicrobium erythreum]ALX06254.1 hypothetical protein AERYTH_16895 [Aeromicrobium erythreum]